MVFKFVEKMDLVLFNRTKSEWNAQIAANPLNTSAPYYAGSLKFLEDDIGGSVATGDAVSCVAGLIEDGFSHAAALLSLSHAKADKHLRLLTIYVQPSLNLADSPPDFNRLALIAATIIVSCLDLTYSTYPSDTLKIYTTLPLDQSFMRSISTAIFTSSKEFSDNFDLSHQGSWLVVKKKLSASLSHLNAVANA